MNGLIALIFATAFLLPAQQPSRTTYPPKMEGAKVETYKTVGGVELKLYVFESPNLTAGEKRPAIVFFFGGGWQGGTPEQFERHCRYFASRGMVAITADYRVASRHASKASDSVRDAKSAIRWVRKNAARLSIDPARIAAGGGSAGGHLAAATGVIRGLDEPEEDLSVSSRPNALVLFNPVLVLVPTPGVDMPLLKAPVLQGVDLAAISPFHHVEKGAPPTIIFHGKADVTVPYNTAELFAKKMAELGNRCELIGFDGEGHGFFNYGRKGNESYTATVNQADAFLKSLGYVSGNPTLR